MVHWHEGLFLQPHHLQALSREVYERPRTERRLLRPFAYGVVECEPVPEALGDFKLQFDKLRVVMPSGVEIDISSNADLPIRDIRREFKEAAGPIVVSLGVPLWQASRANAVDAGAGNVEASRLKRIYSVSEADRADENTGDNAQKMLVRRFNARLVLPGDDTGDLETLPLMRLEAGAGEEDAILPKEDPTFMPACFSIRGSASMRNLLRDLASAVTANRTEQVLKLAGPGVAFTATNVQGQQLLQWLRLRTLNHFAGTLPSLVGATGVSPFDVYLELRALYGELLALSPDRDPAMTSERDTFDSLNYDHDNPAGVFRALDQRIRPLLRDVGKGRFKKIKFAAEGRYLVSEQMEEADFKLPTDYLLGVKSRMDEKAVNRLISDAKDCKLMPGRFKTSRLNVPGIKLDSAWSSIPLELPRASGLHYFRLLRGDSGDMWKWTTEDKRLVIMLDESKPFEYEEVALNLVYRE